MRSLILFTIVFVPMLFEAAHSRRNERNLRAGGALEPEDDVYPVMQVAYPACFIVMILEGAYRGAPPSGWTAFGAGVFAAGKAIKYWAIASLGWRWTFRVLVPAEPSLVSTGPYRWLRHPNYVGVVGELAGTALLAPAPVAGAISVLVFGAILRARIRAEERAMGLRAR